MRYNTFVNQCYRRLTQGLLDYVNITLLKLNWLRITYDFIIIVIMIIIIIFVNIITFSLEFSFWCKTVENYLTFTLSHHSLTYEKCVPSELYRIKYAVTHWSASCRPWVLIPESFIDLPISTCRNWLWLLWREDQAPIKRPLRARWSRASHGAW